MPNYQNGKIYKITSPSTDKIYVGSTTQPLCKRFSDHKSIFNTGIIKSSSAIIMYKDCQIELIEECPCNTKRELEHREQYYLDLYRENIVNQLNAIGNKKEHSIRFKNSQKYKDWYETNNTLTPFTTTLGIFILPLPSSKEFKIHITLLVSIKGI